MSWTSFWTSVFTSGPPDPLPVLARLDTLEGDMLHVRASVDSLQGSLRRVSGKVYRGVALGDTISPEEPEPAPDGVVEEAPGAPEHVLKQELYRRAAALRGR